MILFWSYFTVLNEFSNVVPGRYNVSLYKGTYLNCNHPNFKPGESFHTVILKIYSYLEHFARSLADKTIQISPVSVMTYYAVTEISLLVNIMFCTQTMLIKWKSWHSLHFDIFNQRNFHGGSCVYWNYLKQQVLVTHQIQLLQRCYLNIKHRALEDKDKIIFWMSHYFTCYPH